MFPIFGLLTFSLALATSGTKLQEGSSDEGRYGIEVPGKGLLDTRGLHAHLLLFRSRNGDSLHGFRLDSGDSDVFQVL